MTDQSVVQALMGELIKAGQFSQSINKKIPIHGERFVIPLEDRELEVAFYKAGSAGRPLLLGFHGGGFAAGGSALDDNLWCKLRETLNVNIASVNYRMPPENKWPAAVHDAYDSAVYFKEHADEYGFDPETILITGFSAGGNLTATTCIYAKQKGNQIFKGQILFYPYLDLASDPETKNGEGATSGPYLAAINQTYADESQYGESTLSPVCAAEEELCDLPPAIFCLAGADALCKEGLVYSEQLKAAGVPVCVHISEGMPHAFIENWYADQIPEVMLDPVTKRVLEDGTMETSNMEVMDFVRENCSSFFS